MVDACLEIAHRYDLVCCAGLYLPWKLSGGVPPSGAQQHRILAAQQRGKAAPRAVKYRLDGARSSNSFHQSGNGDDTVCPCYWTVPRRTHCLPEKRGEPCRGRQLWLTAKLAWRPGTWDAPALFTPCSGRQTSHRLGFPAHVLILVGQAGLTRDALQYVPMVPMLDDIGSTQAQASRDPHSPPPMSRNTRVHCYLYQSWGCSPRICSDIEVDLQHAPPCAIPAGVTYTSL
jgi:hypothetical protein